MRQPLRVARREALAETQRYDATVGVRVTVKETNSVLDRGPIASSPANIQSTDHRQLNESQPLVGALRRSIRLFASTQRCAFAPPPARDASEVIGQRRYVDTNHPWTLRIDHAASSEPSHRDRNVRTAHPAELGQFVVTDRDGHSYPCARRYPGVRAMSARLRCSAPRCAITSIRW